MDDIRLIIKSALENNRIGRPCPLLLVGASGIGKTTALRQFESMPGVYYYSGHITSSVLYERFTPDFVSKNIRTFILDDLGHISEQKGMHEKVFGYLSSLCDGKIGFAQHETAMNERTGTVPIISCTPEFFVRKKVQAALKLGLLDRVLPIYFGVTSESRDKVLNQTRYDGNTARLPQIPLNGDAPAPISDEDFTMLKERFRSARQLRIARYLWEKGCRGFIRYTVQGLTEEVNLDMVYPDGQV